MSVYIVIMEMKTSIELETSMFWLVKLYYERDAVGAVARYKYLKSLPQYATFCMKRAWWKRFMIDYHTWVDGL